MTEIYEERRVLAGNSTDPLTALHSLALELQDTREIALKFVAKRDAQVACKELNKITGRNDDLLLRIFCCRTKKQIMQADFFFNAHPANKKKMSITQRCQSRTSGDMQLFMKAVTEVSRTMFSARNLKDCAFGTMTRRCDNSLVNHIICTLSNADIQRLRQDFNTLVSSTPDALTTLLRANCKGEHLQLLLNIVEGRRPDEEDEVTEAEVAEKSKTIFNLVSTPANLTGFMSKSLNSSALGKLVDELSTISLKQRLMIKEAYHRLNPSRQSLEASIESLTSGPVCEALCILLKDPIDAICEGVKNARSMNSVASLLGGYDKPMLYDIAQRFELNFKQNQQDLYRTITNAVGGKLGKYFELWLSPVAIAGDPFSLTDPENRMQFELQRILKASDLPVDGVTESIFFSGVVQANEYVTSLIRSIGSVHTCIASLDADLLSSSVGSVGVDERRVVEVLCCRTKEQQKLINDVYELRYGGPRRYGLQAYIGKNVGGNLQQFLSFVNMNENAFDAAVLHEALSSFRPSKKEIIEVISTRDRARLQSSVSQYRTTYQKNLLDVLNRKIKGPVAILCQNILSGAPERVAGAESSLDRIRSQADDLFGAYGKGARTDDIAQRFIDILANNSLADNQRIANEFEKSRGDKLENVIKSNENFPDKDLQTGLIALLHDPIDFYAKRIREAAQESGFISDKGTINRILGGNDKAIVHEIASRYHAMYSQTLDSMLFNKLSGDHRNAVITWITGTDFATSTEIDEADSAIEIGFDQAGEEDEGGGEGKQSEEVAVVVGFKSDEEGGEGKQSEEVAVVVELESDPSEKKEGEEEEMPSLPIAPPSPDYNVQMYVSGRRLPNSAVNTIAVLYRCNTETSEEIEESRSPVAYRSNNPNYSLSSKIGVYAKFGQVERFRYKIYNIKKPYPGRRVGVDSDVNEEFEEAVRSLTLSSSETDVELIGQTPLFTMDQLMGSKGQCITQTLRDSNDKDLRSKGSLIITGETHKPSDVVVSLRLSARQLKNNYLLRKVDPFYVIKRCFEGSESNIFREVFRSTVVLNNSDPQWSTVRIDLDSLCQGDIYCPLQIEVLDADKAGEHKLIGSVSTSPAALMKLSEDRLKIANALHALSTGRKAISATGLNENELLLRDESQASAGVLIVESALCRTVADFCMQDYIKGGCQIQVMFAIDFTLSNNSPGDEESLHYLGQNPLRTPITAYEKAIACCGDILSNYDFDQMYSIHGFGAKLGVERDEPVSHSFSLAPDGNAEVKGIEGVLAAYRAGVQAASRGGSIKLSGPTLFSEILKEARHRASSQLQYGSSEQVYYILTILTDGNISRDYVAEGEDLTELQKTVDEIVAMSRLPISIIIIGVGDGDVDKDGNVLGFKDMEYLDADIKRLESSTGERQERDIVQFVEYNKFKGHPPSIWEATLEELPSQFMSYMRMSHLPPNVAQAPEDTENEIPEEERLEAAGDGHAAGGTSLP